MHAGFGRKKGWMDVRGGEWGRVVRKDGREGQERGRERERRRRRSLAQLGLNG